MRPAPFVYEINTWIWLQDLARKYERPVQLGDVPAAEWDALRSWGFDTVWLMGVWERSPRGLQIARDHPDLQLEFRRALPDYTPADVVGSPYSIHRYVVDSHLGGPTGLRAARQELAQRGLTLILDFVPNHVALDHPWTREHPEYFIHEAGGALANGRDPYFPPWTDTAQLNAFQAATRAALIATIKEIATQCDGVRCDMAMLLLNDIFKKTWNDSAGPAPQQEFWSEAIPAIKASYPGFQFLGEVYWDLEWTMQQLGFDYTYDKRLYDRLVSEDAASIRTHLLADITYQNKLVRGIENHDESRAASAFSSDKERAALVALTTLPGAKLFHEGQFEGRRIKTPVQLGRRADEPVDTKLREFCRVLLKACGDPLIREGDWQLNAAGTNVLAWTRRQGGKRALIVINYSETHTQGRVTLAPDELCKGNWLLRDRLTSNEYRREGSDLAANGLFIDLPPWGAHFFEVDQTA